MPIKTWATVMPSTLISTVKVYRGVVSIYESHLIFYFNILLCFLVKFSKASCSAGGKTVYTDRASPLLPGHPHLFILNSSFCIREMNFWVIHLSGTKEHVTIIQKGSMVMLNQLMPLPLKACQPLFDFIICSLISSLIFFSSAPISLSLSSL